MVDRLDRQLVLDLYRSYATELPDLQRFDAQRARLGGSYHKEERRILYMVVRRAAPDLIVEFSPKRGLSTLHAALALERNGHGQILSFELGYRSARRALDHLRDNGLAHRVELVLGDVRQELPKALARLRPTGLEFVFIDCDHRASFAQWYTAAVLPAVRRGGLVHIHDVQTDPLAPCPNLPLPPTTEELEVRRFLAARASDYERLSLGDCVRDPSYLDEVRPYGGGDVSLVLEDRRHDTLHLTVQGNPSLWLLKRAEATTSDVLDVPFAPLERSPLRALEYAWRRRRIAARQR